MFGSFTGGMESKIILGVVIVIVLVLAFLPQIIHIMRAVQSSLVSALGGSQPEEVQFLIPEAMGSGSSDSSGNAMGMGIKDGVVSPDSADLMQTMGYGDNVTWDEVLKTTELDPATFANHQDFVKDVRRFSSGANFTSVTDDNTNLAFVNFVGLRRPQQVSIGASARQQPDIDQSVLKRNQPLRWGMSGGDGTYLTAEEVNVPGGMYQYPPSSENFESFVNY
jgi:hypothetical protein